MPPCAVVSILVILANGLSLCLSEVRWPVVNTRPLARLRLRYSIFDLSVVSTRIVGECLSRRPVSEATSAAEATPRQSPFSNLDRLHSTGLMHPQQGIALLPVGLEPAKLEGTTGSPEVASDLVPHPEPAQENTALAIRVRARCTVGHQIAESEEMCRAVARQRARCRNDDNWLDPSGRTRASHLAVLGHEKANNLSKR